MAYDAAMQQGDARLIKKLLDAGLDLMLGNEQADSSINDVLSTDASTICAYLEETYGLLAVAQDPFLRPLIPPIPTTGATVRRFVLCINSRAIVANTTLIGMGAELVPVTNTSVVNTPITIVPAPIAIYNTTLTGPSTSPAAGQPGAGITLTSGGADALNFNNIVGGSTLPQRMNLSIAGTVVAAVDFPTSYLGAAFSYIPAGGTLRSGTFANGTVTI